MRDFLSAILMQPRPRLAVLPLFQTRPHENPENALLHRAVFWWQLRRLATKSRQRFVLRRRLPILVRADDATLEVKALGKQRPVAQPDSISTAELTANRRDFHLKLAAVVPGSLDARA